MQDDEDEEDAEDAVQAALEADYELGVELKEQIIPNAITFFTGEAMESMYGEGDDDDDDDIDEEGDEDDYNSEVRS